MMAVAILWFECDSSLLKNWAIATAAIMLRVEESSTYWYTYSFQASSSAKVSTAASGAVASALWGGPGGAVSACYERLVKPVPWLLPAPGVVRLQGWAPTDSTRRKQSGKHLAWQTRIWIQLKTLSPRLSPTSPNTTLLAATWRYGDGVPSISQVAEKVASSITPLAVLRTSRSLGCSGPRSMPCGACRTWSSESPAGRRPKPSPYGPIRVSMSTIR